MRSSSRAPPRWRSPPSRRSPRPRTSWSASSPGPTPRGPGPPAGRLAGRRCAPRSSACRCSSRRTHATRSSRRRWPRWSPDCCPVVAYGALLPEAALAIPPNGWVNLHFSVLPAWRGAAPVQHAIWAGDEVTGATTFRIVRELDAGPTFGLMTETIRPTDTAGDLLARLAEGGAGLLVATLDGIEDGSLEAREQPARRGQPGAEDHGRGRRGRLVRAGAGGRPAGPRLHARTRRVVDVRRRADQARTRARPTRDHERARPRRARQVAQERRARRHRHRRRCGSGRCRPTGKQGDAGRRLGPRAPARRGRAGGARLHGARDDPADVDAICGALPETELGTSWGDRPTWKVPDRQEGRAGSCCTAPRRRTSSTRRPASPIRTCW